LKNKKTADGNERCPHHVANLSGFASWPLLRVSLLACSLVFYGCSADTQPVISQADDIAATSAEESVDADELACRQDESDESLAAAAFGQLASATSSPVSKRAFRCLRLLDAADVSSADREIHVVNVAKSSPQTPGQLRMPLHEVKTKGFLRGRSLAIVSDGKQFAALEKECMAIKASGVSDVIAVLPEMSAEIGARDEEFAGAQEISPKEFIAERAYGVWRIVNFTERQKLRSPLLADSGARALVTNKALAGRSNAGLVRTLLVFEDDGIRTDQARAGAHTQSFSGQTFVLQGGLAGLQRFEAEATAMAMALARPRINERGCAG